MSSLRILIISFISVLFLGDLYSQSPSWQYLYRMGSNQYYTDVTANKNEIQVLAHMFDSKQNQYLLLYFSGDSFFYNDYSYIRPTVNGKGGGALLKLRCDGSLAWSKILSLRDNNRPSIGDYVTRYSLCFGKDENTIVLGFNTYDRETIRIDADTTIIMPLTFTPRYYSILYDSLGVKQRIVYRHTDTGYAQVNGYISTTNQYYKFKNIDSANYPITFNGVKHHSGDHLILLDSNFNYNKIIPINRRISGTGYFPDTSQPLSLVENYSHYSNPNLYTFVVNHKIYFFFTFDYNRNDNNYKKRLIVSTDTVDFSNWGYDFMQLSGFFVYNDTGKYLFTKYSKPYKRYKNSNNGYSYISGEQFLLGKDKKFYYLSHYAIEDTVMVWGNDTVMSNKPLGTRIANYGSIDTNGKLLWTNNLEVKGTTLSYLYSKMALTPDNDILITHEMHKNTNPPPPFNPDSGYYFKLNGIWYSNDSFEPIMGGYHNKPIIIKLKKNSQELVAIGQNGTRQIKIDYLSVNDLGDIHLFGNKEAPGYILNNDSSDIFYQGTYRDFFIAKYGKGQCNCDTVIASFTTDTTQLAKIKVQYTGTTTDSVLYIWGDGTQTWVKPATAFYTKTYNKDTTVTIQCIAYNNCRQPSTATKTQKIPCDTVQSSFMIIDSNIRGRTDVLYTGNPTDSVLYLWGDGTQTWVKPATKITAKVYNKDTVVTIACIAYNHCGRADTSFQIVHILCDTPTNNFIILSNLNGTVSVAYTGSSMDTVSFLWGDGQQSKVFNPSTQPTNHTYTNLNADSAKIASVIKNKCGIADTLIQTVPIVCDTPTNLFRIKSSNNRTVSLEYYGNSTDTITFLLGDGNQIKVTNPTTQLMTYTYTNNALDSVWISCEVKNKCGKKTTASLIHKFCQPQKKFQTILVCDTNHILIKSADTNLIFQKWSDGTTSNPKTISTSQKITGIYLQKNGCSYLDSFDIKKYSSPTLQKSKKYLDCKKTPISLNVYNVQAINYVWSNASTSSAISVSTKGLYTVRISHVCGIFIDSFTIFDTATSVYDTLRKTVCEKYVWRDSIYTKTGKYTRTISKPNSCDSLLTLDLKVGIEPKVTLSQGVNYAVLEDYKTYQWYLCQPWKKINNETKKTFTTTTRGSYAVVVSNGECVDTSECIALYSSYIHVPITKEHWQIYPNPATDKLYIDRPDFVRGAYSITIEDILGKKMYEMEIKDQDHIEVLIDRFHRGTYILRIESEQSPHTTKFIKE